MNQNDEARTLEEAYTSATNSSNLRVEAEKRGDADLLIASAWSQSRIGGAILRLASEWDSVPKMPPVTADGCMPAFMVEWEVTHPQAPTMDEKRAMRSRAAEAAHRVNLHQMGQILARLKSLPDVRMQSVIQLVRWRVADADNKAPEIIRWWLHQVCPACHGTKWEVVQGTNRQSQKPCKRCHGSGVSQAPHGQEGKKLANWLDDCASRGRAGIRSRLHSIQEK
jgi:hypothetical protein